MIKESVAMTAPKSVDHAVLRYEQLDTASPDLLRQMVKAFADALMSAEADASAVLRTASAWGSLAGVPAQPHRTWTVRSPVGGLRRAHRGLVDTIGATLPGA